MRFCYFAQCHCASQWTALKWRWIQTRYAHYTSPAFQGYPNLKNPLEIWRYFSLNSIHMRFCYFSQFRCASQLTALKWRHILHHIWTLDLLSFPMIARITKIHCGNLEIFQLNLHKYNVILLFCSISLRSLEDSFEMVLDTTPDMHTTLRQLSKDTTISKIHSGNLDIFQLKLHTYHAILLFCSISLFLVDLKASSFCVLIAMNQL